MSRVKVMKVNKSMMSDDMQHMFKQMMGEETPDYSVIKPKYEKLLISMSNVATLLLKFTTMIEKHVPQYSTNYDEMRQYGNSLKELCAEFEIPPMPALDLADTNAKTTYTEYISQVSKKYVALKNNKFIKNLVIVCKDLSVYSKYIKNTDKLSAQFIHESADPDLSILKKITQLPFKQLYLSEKMTKLASAQSYILSFLHAFLKETQLVYEMLSSPDIDIDKFVVIISDGLNTLKKHPELRGCDDAFKKILNSTNMLKENFNTYYGDFMASNNPNIIMEEFISDVSRKVEGNRRLVFQFRKIMGYYRKQIQKQGNAPSQVTGMLNFIGDKLDKAVENDDDDNPESDNEDSEQEGDHVPETLISDTATNSASSVNPQSSSSTSVSNLTSSANPQSSSSTSVSNSTNSDEIHDESPVKKVTKLTKKDKRT